MSKQKTKRNLKIYDEYKNGASYDDLATKYSLSKERIRQILINTMVNMTSESTTSKLYCLMDNYTRVTMTLLRNFGGEQTMQALTDIYDRDHNMTELLKIKGLGTKGVSYIRDRMTEYMSMYKQVDSYFNIYKEYYLDNSSIRILSLRYECSELEIKRRTAAIRQILTTNMDEYDVNLLFMLDMNTHLLGIVLSYFVFSTNFDSSFYLDMLIDMYTNDNDLAKLYLFCDVDKLMIANGRAMSIDRIKNCICKYIKYKPDYFNRLITHVNTHNTNK